jgi:hypothetical protein
MGFYFRFFLVAVNVGICQQVRNSRNASKCATSRILAASGVLFAALLDQGAKFVFGPRVDKDDFFINLHIFFQFMPLPLRLS